MRKRYLIARRLCRQQGCFEGTTMIFGSCWAPLILIFLLALVIWVGGSIFFSVYIVYEGYAKVKVHNGTDNTTVWRCQLQLIDCAIIDRVFIGIFLALIFYFSYFRFIQEKKMDANIREVDLEIGQKVDI